VGTLRTKTQIKNAKKGSHRIETTAGSCGFKKESDTPGVGSYTVRFHFGGDRPTMGLGGFSEIEPAAACEAAAAARALARKGINPIEERKRLKTANLAAERVKRPVTFRQAAAIDIAVRAPLLKGRYAVRDRFRPLETYAFPVIGDLPLDDIVVGDVVAVLRAAIDAGAPGTAKKLPAWIQGVFNGAVARGECDATRRNPADPKLIAAVFPLKRRGPRSHYPRIPLDDAPAAVQALQEAKARASGLQATALDTWLVAIATTARPTEAREMRWDQVDLDKKLRTLPAAESKSGREFVTPLNSIAMAVLERRARLRTGDYVFGGRDGSPISRSRFAAAPAMAGVDLGTAHSWRSLWRDWAGDIGRIDRDLAEAQLQHALGSTEAAYRRQSAIEAGRAPLEAYAKWLSGESADVIQLRPARA
jgi:integrase